MGMDVAKSRTAATVVSTPNQKELEATTRVVG
jgi:hypothetical protein